MKKYDNGPSLKNGITPEGHLVQGTNTLTVGEEMFHAQTELKQEHGIVYEVDDKEEDEHEIDNLVLPSVGEDGSAKG